MLLRRQDAAGHPTMLGDGLDFSWRPYGYVTRDSMQYQFGFYILDADRFELTREGAVLAAGPQVLSLLLSWSATVPRSSARTL